MQAAPAPAPAPAPVAAVVKVAAVAANASGSTAAAASAVAVAAVAATPVGAKKALPVSPPQHARMPVAPTTTGAAAVKQLVGVAKNPHTQLMCWPSRAWSTPTQARRHYGWRTCCTNLCRKLLATSICVSATLCVCAAHFTKPIMSTSSPHIARTRRWC